MIARLVDLQFANSELSELDLEEKLEFIITDLLKVVDLDFKYNRVVIEEFSDSDDEY